MFKVRKRGFAEVRANLDKLRRSVREEVVKAALRDAAAPIVDMASTLCRRSPGGGKHIADAIDAFDRPTEGTKVKLAVSYPAEYFYGHFLEWGTEARAKGVYLTSTGRRRRAARAHRATRPYPFLRPAWDAGKGQILDDFAEATWKRVQAEMGT